MTGALNWCCVWSLFLVGVAADILDCDFFDTVDLTNTIRFENGSYKYEDLIIPAGLTGEYNFTILDDGSRISYPNHFRGCACKLRPCIRFCCHHNKLMSDKSCSHQDYCFQPWKSETGENYSIVPYNCIIEPPMTMAYVKLVSVVFIALTIAVYLWLPMFHNIHGMCCSLYFTCLMISFILNVLSSFGIFETRFMCLMNGYAGYYAVIATFLWLSVISFDLCSRFGLHRFHERTRNIGKAFFNYNLIVWSTAGILTLVIVLVDICFPFSGDINNSCVPAVGVYSCWIMTEGWSAMIYLYTPISILILFNLTMFILTVKHIYEESNQRKILGHFEEKEKSRNRTNFTLYIYLFIIMGGCWFLEVVAFICEMDNILAPLILLNEIINCSQGIIIFMVTVCNKELLKNIRDRLFSKRNRGFDFDTCTITQDCHLMDPVK
ncbi:probable G-protein coupled receptor Mth-like 11 [Drosophila ficusphila]|uniref:probable G-protein coupled receptor Mth-like 11 n=1 Tax=Drosophila ficusphila TaxID=30025 RepID=UPI0007E703C4|nr:probable G-protein coupled receptor Mth-like 11 [Drosophila ficusphila]